MSFLRVAILVLFALTAGNAAAVEPEEIAPGVFLLRGAIVPERGPDGNTVIFEAPGGLVVVDTGRHAWHSDAILAFASARKRPIAAIVNTHWHLDHSSGNGRIKAAHPSARVYTTDAIDRALSEDGFLVRNLAGTRPMLDDPKLSDTRKEEVKIFIATMDERDVLRPDVVVRQSGELILAGKAFDVRVTDGAVTDADVWLIDRASGVAVIGDLVTFPSPFFETACPAKWLESLDEVRKSGFLSAIPGHGEPMSPEEFGAWRDAFATFVSCVNGDTEATQCAIGWADGTARFFGDDGKQRGAAIRYADYYVGLLRENGGASNECRAR